jgi:hypothetical protein
MKKFITIVILSFLVVNIYAQTTLKICINEFLASNVSTNAEIVDFDDFSDWIELYNAENFAADIGGYFITDNPDNPCRWQFPAGTSVPAEGYLLLWADGKDDIPGTTHQRSYWPFDYFTTQYYHLNFKLNRAREFIGIFSPDTTLIDSVTFGLQQNDVSRGRQPDGAAGWFYFGEPTSAGTNASPGVQIIDYAESPSISLSGGFYGGSQSVTIGAVPAYAEIRYTRDGSKPTSSSALYTTPLSIDQTTVLKARIFEANKLPGKVVTRTYFIGTNFSLPVISLSTPPELLWEESIGIYEQNFKEREIPVHFEFFETDGSPGFNLDAGLSLTGQASLYYPQKSFTIATDDRFGTDDLTYQIFPQRELNTFTSLYLRNAGVPDHRSTFFRDALLHTLVLNKMDLDCQAYRPAVIFLNGAYWGILNIRDKINKDYIGSLHNLNPDDVDLLEYESNINPTVMEGQPDNYYAFYDYVTDHDLSLTENYRYLETWMDIDEFINYQICEIYCDNVFWADQNVRMWRERKEDKKWRWVLYDADYGFGMPNQRSAGYTNNTLKFATSSNSGDPFIPPLWSTVLFRKLLLNPEFKIKFIQRFASYLNSVFHPDTVVALIDQIQDNLSSEMPRHIARWRNGEPYYGNPIPDYPTWLSNVNVVRTFARNRPYYQRQHILNYFQLGGTSILKLDILNPGMGQVYINGIEKIATSSSGIYFKDIPTKLEAVPEVGYRFVKWAGGTNESQNPLDIILTGDTLALQAVFEAVTISTIPAELTFDTTLSITNSPYYALTDIVVDSNVTLTIEAGVQILMPENCSIIVQGGLLIKGVSGNPVIISPNEYARDWGALCFVNATDSSVIEHLKIIAASDGPDFNRDQAAISGYNSRFSLQNITVENLRQAPVFIKYGKVSIRDCQLHTDYAGDLINVKYADYALTENCDLRGGDGFDSDGIDYDQIAGGIIRGNKIYNIYGFNSDAIDLGEGAQNILVENNIIFNINDKGVSVGQASTTRIKRNLIANCGQGVGIKDFNSYAWIEHNTFYGNHYGVASFEKNTGHGGGNGDVVNCLLINSIQAAVLVDELSQLNVSYSLSNTDSLRGLHNLQAEPLLINNLRLSPHSPAIDNGNPVLPPDPDGSLPDLGAYPLDLQNQNNLFINEIHYHPAAGENHEFIELVNAGSAAIELAGYELSGDLAYTFGAESIDQREFIVVAKDGSVYQGQGYKVLQWDTGNLPDGPGSVVLYDNLGNLVDFVNYDRRSFWPDQPDGTGPSLELHHVSLENMVASSWRNSYIQGGTPGKSNSSVLLSSVFINEFMADNSQSYADENGEYDDWLELYNSNTVPVNIGGLFLTDNFNVPGKYLLPNYAAQLTTIPAKGFLVLWADGETADGILHLPFKLDRSGERIGVAQALDSGSVFIDSLSYPAQTTDISFGRYPDGTASWYPFDQPTPLASNRLIDNLPGNPLLIRSYSLSRNYPNPFNPSTSIRFSIPKTEFVSLEIYNLLGQKVARLVNERQEAGEHTVKFNGSGLASGIYFYKIAAGDFQQVRKMVLIR